MRPKEPVLTQQELEIMKVVWRLGSPTVRQVYEELLTSRHIAYTTVMTMMNVLEKKGYLVKERQDRAYIYQATKPQKQVIRSMVRDFLGRVFNGSAEPLLVHLIEDEQLNEKEVEDLRRMIQARRRKPQ